MAARKSKKKASSKKSAKATRADRLAEEHPRKELKSPAKLRALRKAEEILLTVTHKARAAWFQAREAWPMREAPVDRLIAARARARTSIRAAAGANNWVEAGPANIGGRTTSVVAHPNDSDLLIVGAAGGGVWTSDDGGHNWTSRWHNQATLNIGSLALDPANPDTVYCGTGEANLSADSHAGVGLFRSLDFGASWHLFAPADAHDLPRRIGAIAVDPYNADRILIGGVNHLHGMPTGMFASEDGGSSWARMDNILGGYSYRCHAIAFHPARRGWVYATIDNQGQQSGVWRSKNHGRTWSLLWNGLPYGSDFGRASIALAPSAPDIIYMLVSSRDSYVLGVYRTDDAGDTWTDITGNHFNSERQMSYNNTIVVHPDDSDHVLCGGVDLHRTRNGGAMWQRVTEWNLNRADSQYAHADQHGLIMPASTAGLVYAVNDGGLDVSADGGSNWENRSDGLATNMFYDLEVAKPNRDIYGGGAQDNGTIITSNGAPGNFFEITGGDGGWLVFDPVIPLGHLFTNVQFMSLYRYVNGGWTNVSPPEADIHKPWMAYTAMDPSDPDTVYCCSNAVWKTTDDAASWTRVSGRFDGSTITAFEVCRADPDRLYAGTENGNIFRSEDGGATWIGNLANTTLPGFTITRIRSAPDDADRVFATVANFGSAHVFRSNNAGDDWVDVDNGDLPDVPHHGIAISELQPATIYVANDVGVYVSTNAGGSWRNLTGNLPNAPVIDIVHHNAGNTLYVATYGRSMWTLQL